jgi:L-iditol 2-dehydrogenase
MKTAAVTKIGSLRDPVAETRGVIEVIDLPSQMLGPEDVRVRVAYAGICGSDPHVAEGYFGESTPLGLGHEVSGVIEELGALATRNGLRIGDRVAGNFLRYCGSCIDCRDGRQQFCAFAQEYNRPGMAETLVWHESQVFKLPDSVSLKAGALLEPTSVALRIVDKGRIRTGDRVLVCGGGAIGQLVLQIAARAGATSLTVVEPLAVRREVAIRRGAEWAIDPIHENQQIRAQEITGGRGYDVVIDASGAARATAGLLALAARGGTVVYGGMYPSDFEMPLNLAQTMFSQELTITGAFLSPYTFPRALNLLPHLDLEDFTQSVYPLEQAAEAFDRHLSGEFLKVLIRPNIIADSAFLS